MHCSWAARLSPCNPEGHSTLPFASGLLAWPSWLSPTAEHVWDGVCWGGGGTGQVGCPSPAHLEVLVVAMTSPRL